MYINILAFQPSHLYLEHFAWGLSLCMIFPREPPPHFPLHHLFVLQLAKPCYLLNLSLKATPHGKFFLILKIKVSLFGIPRAPSISHPYLHVFTYLHNSTYLHNCYILMPKSTCQIVFA